MLITAVCFIFLIKEAIVVVCKHQESIQTMIIKYIPERLKFIHLNWWLRFFVNLTGKLEISSSKKTQVNGRFQLKNIFQGVSLF